ncbi:MAG: YncE family protein, partial [Candidatus Acidiferrales bacterium]
MKKTSLFCTLVLGIVSTGLAATGHHLLKKISVGGQGDWDYLTVDDAARRVYVSHATQVEVLDPDPGTVVGKIPNLHGVHGIALAPEFGRGFITNGRTGTVTVFDVKTLKKLAEVAVGKKPDAIVYDPGTHRVFAMNGDSNSSTAIDAATGKVAGTVDLGGGPEFAAAD